MNKEWSPEYKYCRKCYETTHKHAFFGYCKKCYDDMEQENDLSLPKLKLRKCLKCGDEFYSKGPGNRKCEVCHRKEAGSSLIDKNRYKVSIKIT